MQAMKPQKKLKKTLEFQWFIYSLKVNVENTIDIFRQAKKIVVCELNRGQFVDYLRAQFPDIKFNQYNKTQGLPFTTIELTQHFEFYYEFELEHFHVGPQIDIGFEDNETHYMLGLHFGIDF